MTAYVSYVRFVISEEEDLSSGPGPGSDSQNFMWQKFYYSDKEQRKLLKGDGECPFTSLSRELHTFSIRY